jgi:hypothetical protein
LSAECARWAARSCWEFIDAFHERLSIASPLAAYEKRFVRLLR